MAGTVQPPMEPAKALPKTATSLGIVYTPIEIVDFINRAVNDLLAEHFDGASISDEGVHVLDPFTGTGTFIARLLQSGLIRPEDLQRKYRDELHANELMLLAYYIAAINIETVYDALTLGKEYEPFEGIVLTDTFAMAEHDTSFDTVFFPNNNARADKQRELDIRVILGNPPYSVGQASQNDDNQNLDYPALDESIRTTYAAKSTAKLKRNLYDSYVRAYRWATNRVSDSENGGIVGFVSNGGWLDGNTGGGIRASFAEEFHHIYVFNLRGNSRTSGKQRRREGDGVFDQGSRNTVTITLLVKQAGPVPDGGAQIHYRDIGDYLDRDTKLAIVDHATIDGIDWQTIHPNKHHDWVNQRDDRWDTLIPLTGDNGLFHTTSLGVLTGRDSWVYNSSSVALRAQAERMVNFYNDQVDIFHAQADPAASRRQLVDAAKKSVNRDPTEYSWDRSDFARIAAGTRYELRNDMIRASLYRPFMSQRVVFDRSLNNTTYQLPSLFPPGAPNHGILLVDPGSKSPFGTLAASQIPCLHVINSDATKFYARWRYEEHDPASLLSDSEQQRVSNLNRSVVGSIGLELGSDISEDDVFAYVYGVLHSPEFRETFEVNLKKEDPRIPLVDSREDFDAFATAGQELLDLHIGYETIDPYPLMENWRSGSDPQANPDLLLVGTKRMKYPKVTDPETGKKVPDKTRLVYNDHLTLEAIPERVHDYKLGTRSGIDWIIDRWYVKTDKASGIVNDVNQWGLEQGQPRYIIDLVGRVVTLSLRTLDIIDSLPQLEF